MLSDPHAGLPVLEVQRVGKAYRQFDSEWQRIASWFGLGGGGLRQAKAQDKTAHGSQRWVLEEISFHVQAGEAIGIVGANGAGKSTLLKILAGTTQASCGSIGLRGRVAAILELGMGFNIELDADANARHALGLMGFDAARIDAMLPDIEAFAEIGEAWAEPLRTYSTGMQMRVAFAVVSAARPDVLIVDEALSVGDAYFQHKCIERIRQFRHQGSALVIVSHDPAAVISLCSRALLLDRGRVLMDGDPAAVIDFYNALIAEKANRESIQSGSDHFGISTKQRLRADGLVETESGDRAAVFESVTLQDDECRPVEFVQTGQSIQLIARVKILRSLPRLVFGFMIKNRLGQVIYGTNTYHKRQVLEALEPGQLLSFHASLQANLGPGSYSVSVALTSTETHLIDNFHWRDVAIVFHIYNDQADYFVGTAALASSIRIASDHDAKGSSPRANLMLQAEANSADKAIDERADLNRVQKPWREHPRDLSGYLQALSKRWAAVDAAYLPSARLTCRLCGHDDRREAFVERLAICKFGGGLLRRYQCPACDVIAGDEKIFALSAEELDAEYREHYRFYDEGDSTTSEMRCFFSLNPERGKRYLNWGAGAWSSACERLRAQGWSVLAYEPFVEGDSGQTEGHREPVKPFTINRLADLKGEQFDGIFSHNLLEHLCDPIATLKLMSSLLRPGGRMAHATPCFEYLFEYTRFHLFFYCGRSRDVLIERAGLEALHWEADWEAQGAAFFNLVLARQGDVVAQSKHRMGQSAPHPVATSCQAGRIPRLPQISYAQNREDIVLWRALKDVTRGFYVDVGAAHPVVDSVSKLFYDKGWSGINVEPDPRHAIKLARDRARDLTVCIALGREDPKDPEARNAAAALGSDFCKDRGSIFWLSADPASSSATKDYAGPHPMPWKVQRKGLSQLIDELVKAHPDRFNEEAINIHWLKIDVEGEERAVLESLDLKRHRPWIVLLEATRPHGTDSTHHAWEALLLSEGYVFAWFDGLNRYYLSAEQAYRKPALALQPNVFDAFMPYSESLATLYWHESVFVNQLKSGVQAAERPRLAYCCPMPPDESGVAYYGAMLLPELATIYDITLVTPRGATTDAWAQRAALPVIDSLNFSAQIDRFDRILYHLGNSPFHAAMFDQLRLRAAAVVLHDVHLADFFAFQARQAGKSDAFLAQLADAHGLVAAARVHRGSSSAASEQRFSLIPLVLEHAHSVVVHSEHAMEVLRDQLHPMGKSRGIAWSRILKTRLPRITAELRDRKARSLAARTALGIAPGERLLLSLGYLHESKRSDEVLALFAWLCQSQDRPIHLRFVGALAAPESAWALAFKASLDALAVSFPNCSVAMTGWVGEERYQQWIDAADIAIQLRNDSRGESSGAALDALAGGLALLVNRHGALSELHAAHIADDREQMLQMLKLWLLDDIALHQAQHGAHEYLDRYHNPTDVAAVYAQAIEQAYRSADPVLDALIYPQATLWIDVSALAIEDLRTGIQRVVRAVVMQWLRAVDHAWRIELVRMADFEMVQAKRLAEQWLRLDDGVLGEEAAVLAAPGDVVLFLDLATDHVVRNEHYLAALAKAGIGIQALVYDLLPISHPHWFPSEAVEGFKRWAEVIAKHAGALHCISRATAQEVSERLDFRGQLRWCHLGSDLEASVPSSGDSEALENLLSAWDGRPTLCMVSTVEPRKGHRQVLDAMEELWKQGKAIRIVIVGKPGWMVDALLERLRTHPQRGKHLFWFESASDALLEAVYRRSQLLVMASEAEGFGLPVVEASRHGLALLLRDLPVFREIADGYAMWFDRDDRLAEAIELALEAVASGCAPDSREMPRLLWQECAKSLMDHINQAAMSDKTGSSSR